MGSFLIHLTILLISSLLAAAGIRNTYVNAEFHRELLVDFPGTPVAVLVIGDPDRPQVEVIDFVSGGENSCIGHHTPDHVYANMIGLKVEGRPTICGGEIYGNPYSACQSLDIETGYWGESFPMIEERSVL